MNDRMLIVNKILRLNKDQNGTGISTAQVESKDKIVFS